MAVARQRSEETGQGTGRKSKPGPPPGTHHRGTFKPGYDPRRALGSVAQSVRQALEVRARESTEAAVALIESVMLDTSEPTRLRVACATELLDRGHGRTMSREQVLARQEGGAGALPVESLSDEQILEILVEGRRRTQEFAVEGSIATNEEARALIQAESIDREATETPGSASESTNGTEDMP